MVEICENVFWGLVIGVIIGALAMYLNPFDNGFTSGQVDRMVCGDIEYISCEYSNETSPWLYKNNTVVIDKWDCQAKTSTNCARMIPVIKSHDIICHEYRFPEEEPKISAEECVLKMIDWRVR